MTGNFAEGGDGLPKGYGLQMMDETLFRRCRETGWCRDWVAQYENYDLYQRYGLGAVIIKDGEPVSGHLPIPATGRH